MDSLFQVQGSDGVVEGLTTRRSLADAAVALTFNR